jgi:hypothetical protein
VVWVSVLARRPRKQEHATTGWEQRVSGARKGLSLAPPPASEGSSSLLPSPHDLTCIAGHHGSVCTNISSSSGECARGTFAGERERRACVRGRGKKEKLRPEPARGKVRDACITTGTLTVAFISVEAYGLLHQPRRVVDEAPTARGRAHTALTCQAQRASTHLLSCSLFCVSPATSLRVRARACVWGEC